MALGQGSYTRTNGGATDRVYPRFFLDEVKDELASTQAGRDIFKSEERVEVIFPGNPWNKPVFKVAQEHIDRWPEAYKAFQQGNEMALDGVPIEHWPVLKRAQVLELKSLGFRTVENVAAMSDHAVQRIGMGGQRLRDLAKSYLDEEVAAATLAKATAESEKLKQQVNEQASQIKNLSEMLERVSADLIALRNAPSPIQTHIPGMHDPAEAYRQAQPREAPSQSSLADMPAPRRRGKASEAAA